ncbi:MAG: hypothetical protein N5P05_002964 [Chroococcopsis gigantea SAG 12.99]|jgi:hypothetical protein|nr:sulfotransferase [Chlorogloea purpurea SAG 13.99]MDV3001358.1 hypothetical protein [Chroococcopsis gigantea SAG 12.99]
MPTTVKNPLFLVGAERSGTTLLRLMLSYHPLISWSFEFEYSVDLMGNDGQFPDLDSYYEFLEVNRIFKEANLNIDKSLTYEQLLNSFLHQWQERDNKPIIGATVHRDFDKLLYIWPEARFVHIVRDPRDVAYSCIEMGWASNTFYGIKAWIEAENLWERMKNQLPPEKYIEIQYENLLGSPIEVLSQICSFMGIDYDAAMLSYPAHTTYKYPNSKYAYKWKEKNNPKDIQLIECQLKGLLEKRGYEHSGLPIIELSPAQIKQLKLQNRVGCLKFRLKRYGFNLTVKSYLAKKLGLTNLQKVAQIEINEIDKLYVK